MNIKRTLFAGLAMLGLMASIAAPIANAQDSPVLAGSDQKKATIVLNNDGQFFAVIRSDLDLGTHNLQAGTGAFGFPGTVIIDYTDTYAFRGGFSATLQASDFQRTAGPPMQVWPALPTTIPADNLTITEVTGPTQGQCCRNSGVGGVAGISAVYPNGVDTTTGTATWAGATPAQAGLGTASTIHMSLQGKGTIWTEAPVQVNMQVPASAVPGTYESTLTLTIAAYNP